MKKKITAILAVCTIAASLSGCGSSTSTSDNTAAVDTATVEVRQNDYRGGVKRTEALQTNVLKVMENMKVNNTVIRQDNPDSYWTTDGYQDFVSTFLDIAIIDDTQWFNEEETSWDTVLSQMASTVSTFSDGGGDELAVTVTRNEKDDYSVSGVSSALTVMTDSATKTYSGTAEYRILYDCDKDWCKAYATMTIDNELPAVTNEMFEYQRVDENTFAIQTSRERLVVVLAPAEGETDIRSREIKEFYYSKLVLEGQRTTFEPYEELPEYDIISDSEINENVEKNELMAEYSFMNEAGELASQYGVADSMFYHSPTEINSDWVFEDKALQQGIAYKDGVLVVTTYNKLSGNYERFIYSVSGADKKITSQLETLVEIDGLVGIQSSTSEVDESALNNEESTAEGEENSLDEVESKAEQETTETDASATESSEEAKVDMGVTD